MSYCLNPDCHRATSNPPGAKFCHGCGSKLLLKERYRAIKIIGQGGFGRTFLAVDEDKPSKPRCVIKQFFPQPQGTNNAQKAAELFEQEAVRLDDLGLHPQIPELLAYFTHEQRQYLVQEFVDGQNLAQILAAEGAFKEAQIRDLLNSLLPVVEFIHTHHVIHRDIKPENIIRRSDGQLVLVDFGAAKFATGTALLKTGTSIGSPEYLAPEQARGKAVFASDLYSLGVTCIHLLTQVSPFDLFDISEDAWVWRHYLVNNPVSDELGRILDKLIENATNRRYQLPLEVLKALNPQPTNAAPKPPPPVPPRYRKQIFSQTPPNSTSKAHNSPPAPQPQTQNWRCVHTLTGHSSWVYSVAFSPDGQTLASGSGDKTIKLWQTSSGKLICTLTGWFSGHSNSVLSVAFSPDGQALASGSYDKTIKLWQTSSAKLIGTLTGHSDSVYSVAFSPDGQTLASGSADKTIKIWQISTGKLIGTLTGHSDSVYSVAFSPDGQTLASGSGTINLWQTSSGKLIRTLTEHSSSVYSVAFSPDLQTLASGSYDKTIKLWQTSSGKLIHTLTGHSDSVYSVAFSPDGQALAGGSADKTIKIWQCD